MPKKNVNQVLYQMLKESKVSQERPAMWGLGQGGTREVEPAEPARPSQGNLPARREQGGGPSTGTLAADTQAPGLGSNMGSPNMGSASRGCAAPRGHAL